MTYRVCVKNLIQFLSNEVIVIHPFSGLKAN